MGQITFTDQAVDQVRQIMESQDMVPEGTVGLRVFVSGGGCSGFQYGFSPVTEEEINEDDEQWSFEGTRFVVDPLSMMYLEGSTVDFKQDVMAQQFTISNPNSSGSCGCGQSFSA